MRASLPRSVRARVANVAQETLFLQSIAGIDARSEQILRILAREARLPNLDPAARVGLSPSACLRRVQELERRGVITG